MPVNVSVHGTTTVVEIDRPERRNALDGPTLGGIGAAFAAAEADDAIRAVVLTGAGADAFCAGADLRATGADRSPPAGSPSIDVFTTRCYPKPVIAAVNGAAVGGGFELVLAADLVVAAEHATFSVPEVKRGLVGAGCTTRLASRLPPAVVFELCGIGDPFPAPRALELGLVNAVVPGAEVLPAALALAERSTAGAPLAIALTKQLLWNEARMHDAEEWAAIRALAAPIFASADAAEGRAAFAERRAARWSGR
jgi:enoyl-CoA hydratase/carnithine racemase